MCRVLHITHLQGTDTNSGPACFHPAEACGVLCSSRPLAAATTTDLSDGAHGQLRHTNAFYSFHP